MAKIRMVEDLRPLAAALFSPERATMTASLAPRSDRYFCTVLAGQRPDQQMGPMPHS